MNIQNKDLYLFHSMIYHEQFANFDGVLYFSILLSSWSDQETALVSFE